MGSVAMPKESTRCRGKRNLGVWKGLVSNASIHKGRAKVLHEILRISQKAVQTLVIGANPELVILPHVVPELPPDWKLNVIKGGTHVGHLLLQDAFDGEQTEHSKS